MTKNTNFGVPGGPRGVTGVLGTFRGSLGQNLAQRGSNLGKFGYFWGFQLGGGPGEQNDRIYAFPLIYFCKSRLRVSKRSRRIPKRLRRRLQAREAGFHDIVRDLGFLGMGEPKYDAWARFGAFWGGAGRRRLKEPKDGIAQSVSESTQGQTNQTFRGL
jgi:hypothetical protein